jgi:hypothetical protein
MVEKLRNAEKLKAHIVSQLKLSLPIRHRIHLETRSPSRFGLALGARDLLYLGMKALVAQRLVLVKREAYVIG